MKKLLSIVAGLALVAGTSTRAQAQTCTTASCTVTHTVSATAPTVLNLTLSSITTALTNPTATDFDVAAGIDDAGPTVTLKSNKNASVTISTAAANWTGPLGTTKSVGDLRWRTSGGGPGTALSGTAADVIVSGKGNRNATVTWNTLWNLSTDEPGAYSLATTFTLVAP
jgi:hypothetical protein